MPQDEQPGVHQRREIQPVYRPSDDGTIIVYAGDLLLAIGTDEHIVRGNLALRLSPRPEFAAQVASSDCISRSLWSLRAHRPFPGAVVTGAPCMNASRKGRPSR